MKVAIENMAKLEATSKVLMLGAMMELGEESEQEHQQIVELIKKYNWNEVVLVGGDYANINHSFRYFNNSTEAGEWFKERQFSNTYILVKGSRSMQMEKILDGAA
jgi:UDP-N-acetylmuramoyl-tripeptide--D-alanyl-D-alanine ligase